MDPSQPKKPVSEEKKQALDTQASALAQLRALGYSKVPRCGPLLRGKSVQVLKAAQSAPGLAQLIAQASRSRSQVDDLTGLVPALILKQIHSGPMESGNWILMLRSGASAAKLRQMGPAICAHLRSKGWDIQSITVRVIQA
ncbi:MAG: hypothetical protein WCL48_09815 [Betaproteobacteria bacterium]|jgi:hypothetical protein